MACRKIKDPRFKKGWLVKDSRGFKVFIITVSIMHEVVGMVLAKSLAVIPDDATVHFEGSLAEGFGNDGSDIDLLARHFVATLNERFESSRRISDAALRVCRAHTWPGNVRELLHAMESAMVVCEGPEILPEHLPQTVRFTVTAPLQGTLASADTTCSR